MINKVKMSSFLRTVFKQLDKILEKKKLNARSDLL